MNRCPHCGESIMAYLNTTVLVSRGTGNAPLEVPVLLISCPHQKCGKLLGILNAPPRAA